MSGVCLHGWGFWVNYSTEEGNLREDDGIPALIGKVKIESVRSEGGHIQQIEGPEGSRNVGEQGLWGERLSVGQGLRFGDSWVVGVAGASVLERRGLQRRLWGTQESEAT